MGGEDDEDEDRWAGRPTTQSSRWVHSTHRQAKGPPGEQCNTRMCVNPVHDATTRLPLCRQPAGSHLPQIFSVQVWGSQLSTMPPAEKDHALHEIVRAAPAEPRPAVRAAPRLPADPILLLPAHCDLVVDPVVRVAGLLRPSAIPAPAPTSTRRPLPVGHPIPAAGRSIAAAGPRSAEGRPWKGTRGGAGVRQQGRST